MHRNAARIAVLCVATTLVACGSHGKRDGPGSSRIPELPGDAVPRPEPRSKHGNGPVYEVRGKRYTVMQSSAGYRERGVASWYGSKFHDRLTSNRETYDMYAMTAANKTLPLPTYVRVRNLRNNKTVVVRVNDRGPFVSNRIIDLSYVAALKLDMIRDGTSLVEVTAINFAPPRNDRPARQVTPPEAPGTASPLPVANRIYVQVGAFGNRANAERRLNLISRTGIHGAFIRKDASTYPTLYRVRIGPVADAIQYDVIVEELENIGIMDPYLITE